MSRRLSEQEIRRRRAIARRGDLSRTEQARLAGVTPPGWCSWLRRAGVECVRSLGASVSELPAERVKAGTLTLRVSRNGKDSLRVTLSRPALAPLRVREGDRVRVVYDALGERIIVSRVGAGRAA